MSEPSSHARALAKLGAVVHQAMGRFEPQQPGEPHIQVLRGRDEEKLLLCAALRAVLELHKPFRRASGEMSYFCDHCSEDLPCTTVTRLAAALEGE